MLHPVNLNFLEYKAAFTSIKSQCAFKIVRFGIQLLVFSGMFTLHDIYITLTPSNLFQHPLGAV